MGANTAIEWAHHTFNPWWGCDKVSAECDHCYAEALAKRFGVGWGPKAERRTFGRKKWQEPLAWDRAAAKAGERHRVFCASMADVFDIRGPEEERFALWELIQSTANLDWLLLTKRPQLAGRFLPWWGGNGPEHLRPWRNVWIGTSVGVVATKNRLDQLREIPAVRRFVSFEPLLEDLGEVNLAGIDWAIVGGESGPGARPMHEDWVRWLRDECLRQGVKFFYKQKLTGVGKKLSLPVLDGRQWQEVP